MPGRPQRQAALRPGPGPGPGAASSPPALARAPAPASAAPAAAAAGAEAASPAGPAAVGSSAQPQQRQANDGGGVAGAGDEDKEEQSTLEAVARGAAEAQPTGTTLSTTKVSWPVGRTRVQARARSGRSAIRDGAMHPAPTPEWRGNGPAPALGGRAYGPRATFTSSKRVDALFLFNASIPVVSACMPVPAHGPDRQAWPLLPSLPAPMRPRPCPLSSLSAPEPWAALLAPSICPSPPLPHPSHPRSPSPLPCPSPCCLSCLVSLRRSRRLCPSCSRCSCASTST